MSKSISAEELLSNLGLSEVKLPEEELSLSGEGSTLYAAEGETEEGGKLFDLDDLRYSSKADIKLEEGQKESTEISDKSKRVKKISESV